MKADGKFYRDGDKEYPRVTSVIERWYDPSGAMTTWVAQESKRLGELASKGLPAKIVDSVWTGKGFEWAVMEKDPLELLQDTKWMTGAAYRAKQGAMDRGTLTNSFIDQWTEGMRITPDEVPEWCEARFEEGKLMPGATLPTPWKADLEDLVLHVCSALKWLVEREPEILRSQIQVVSDDPLYAGTPDALGRLEGTNRLFEYKTGQPNRAHALQVAAYAPPIEKLLELELIPTVVYFTRDRYREVTIVGEHRDKARAAFLRALQDFEFSREETPWQNGVSVPLTSDDLPFVI